MRLVDMVFIPFGLYRDTFALVDDLSIYASVTGVTFVADYLVSAGLERVQEHLLKYERVYLSQVGEYLPSLCEGF